MAAPPPVAAARPAVKPGCYFDEPELLDRELPPERDELDPLREPPERDDDDFERDDEDFELLLRDEPDLAARVAAPLRADALR